jgi:hypothetical protein
MSDRAKMEAVLHDLLLLPDLQAVHKATKSERLKLRIEKYIERILEALEDSPDESPWLFYSVHARRSSRTTFC